MTDAIQIQTTTSDRAEAERLATQLLQQRLAACVQVSGPITSSYWWNDQLETSEEWLCTIKTLRDLYDQVEQAIHRLHSYDEPEILALPVIQGSDGYLNWLANQVRKPVD